jgi:hypothetical protein
MTELIVSIIIFCVPLILAAIFNILIDHGLIMPDIDYFSKKEEEEKKK